MTIIDIGKEKHDVADEYRIRSTDYIASVATIIEEYSSGYFVCEISIFFR